MSKEAMKLALDALESGLDYAENENFENKLKFRGYEHLMPSDAAESVEQIKTAIKSLRQAIEQAQKQERTGSCPLEDCDGGPETHGCWAHNCEWKAQKQEPVAYIRKDQLQKATQSPLLCEVSPEPRQDRIGIWTSPPQRQPLTDEQILDAHVIAKASFKRSQQGVRGQMLTSQDLFDWHLARAIEAAHGIKE